MRKIKDRDIQLLIGQVLRTGMVVSISIVIFGAIFYIYRHGSEIADYRKFTGVPDFVQHTGILISSAIDLRGRAIIQIGIILLIATPILRVVFSGIGFLLERDYMYVGISVIVLLIIFISMMTEYGG